MHRLPKDNMNNEFVQPVAPTDPNTNTNTDGNTTDDKDKDKTQAVSQPEHKGKIDFAAMQEKYPDVVGWIYGANTGLDWPIVQTAEEGRRVLPVPRHRRQGQQERHGVPGLALLLRFLYAEQHDLRPQHETGLMFAPLIKYKSQAFYDAHSLSVSVYAVPDL